MPNKLKIGLVLDDTLDTPDGVQQYVLTLGNWLAQQGHEVHYLVGHTSRNDIENIHSMAKNVKVKYNQNRLSIPLPANRKKITAILEKLRLDVLHIQTPYSPLFAGRVISAAPPYTRIVGTFHIVPATWLEHFGARTLQLLNARTLRRFHTMIAVSPAAQQFAKTVFGIESVIIPNAVSLTQFSHKPIFKKPLRIVFLGRLVERKGCQYLLQALAVVQNKTHIPPYEVFIAGKGPLNDKLQKYAINKQLQNVHFIGFVAEEDKAALLASADIAVYPSTGGESFGIVLIEAMAAGARVVLGGNNVGYQSVLGDNPALLFDPKNTTSFADTIAHFLQDNEARHVAHEWAQSAVQQYNVAVIGKRILNVYQD